MTITSNIHLGLVAWHTAHAYTAGNRISSNGNAYQAITTGTSGATTPSGTSTDFFDGVVHWKYLSAITYSSLSQWEASIPATLTDNVVGQLWNNGAITTTAGVPFLTLGVSGAPRTLGIYSIKLTCGPGESFRDTLRGTNIALNASAANGVCFTLPATAGSINYFDIYDGVTFDGLQFIDPCSTSLSTILNANPSTTFTLTNCIVDGYAQDGGANMIAADTLLMANCLIVDRQATGANGFAVQSGDNNAASFAVNTTFVRINPTNGSEAATAFLTNNASSRVRNSIFCGYLNAVGGAGALVLVDYSATTSATVGVGTDNGHNQFNISAAAQFISATSDFRAKAGAIAVNAGVTDTADLPSATDILGYARPQGTAWSLGASEFTGQMQAAVKIGSLAATGGVSAANTASSTQSIGPFTTLVSAGQSDRLSALVTAGSFTAVAASGQSDLLGATPSIGSIAASGNIVVALNNASCVATLGLTCAISAINSDQTSAVVAVGTITATANAIQSDNLVAAPTLTFSCTGTISPTLMSAAIPLTLRAVGVASQFFPLNASPGIGPLSSVGSANIATVASLLQPLGTFAAQGTLQQNDGVSAAISFALTSVVAAKQIVSASAQASLLIAVTAGANAAYLASALDAIAAGLSAVVAAGQSDILSAPRLSLGSFVTVASGTNPVEVKALVSLPSFRTIGSLSNFDAAGTVTIGPITAVGVADPYKMDARPSLPAIVLANTANLTNLAPLPMSAIVSIGNFLCSSVSGQSNLVSLLWTIRFSATTAAINAPILRVSQVAGEVLTSGGTLRVSQASAEILSSGGTLRVSQAAIEVLAQSPALSNARVSQLTGEALVNVGAPQARVSQVMEGVLTGGIGNQNVRVSQALTEVLSGGATNQNVFITQVAVEILIPAAPIAVPATSYIMV